MVIPVFDLTRYNGDDWEDYLNNVNLFYVFKELIRRYGADKAVCTSIVRYIVFAYSVDSDKIVLGMDWLENKKQILKSVGLNDKVDYTEERFKEDGDTYKPSFYETIVLLQSPTILKTIKAWLDFQDNPTFSTLQMINDLIVEFRMAANSPIRKSTGEIDFEQKRKCAESVIELLEKKRKVEMEFIQNNPKLKDAYREISNSLKKKRANAKGMESFLKQHEEDVDN